uniref:Uncharacterized protein n=1 Tax=Anguilla anguilla TaxID=7936 RepID=A0A0E9V6Z6_ANGAN
MVGFSQSCALWPRPLCHYITFRGTGTTNVTGICYLWCSCTSLLIQNS